MATLSIERKNLILEKLGRDKKVVVSALAEEFSVSEETIRRDLDKLEKEGFAIKSYGGAVLNENNNNDMPFQLRQRSNMEGKKKIAKIISEYINDGDHIFIDPSSTGVSIIKACEGKKHLTIITNSVEVLLELSENDDWSVISTGGQLMPNYLALVGPVCLNSIEGFHADKVILSCKGIDLERGITDANELFSQVKQQMLKSAAQKILAVDSSKFNKVAFSQICKINEIDIVVTDQKPQDSWIRFFEDNGIKVLYDE